jgi:hypothetical protein
MKIGKRGEMLTDETPAPTSQKRKRIESPIVSPRNVLIMGISSRA